MWGKKVISPRVQTGWWLKKSDPQPTINFTVQPSPLSPVPKLNTACVPVRFQVNSASFAVSQFCSSCKRLNLGVKPREPQYHTRPFQCLFFGYQQKSQTRCTPWQCAFCVCVSMCVCFSLSPVIKRSTLWVPLERRSCTRTAT